MGALMAFKVIMTAFLVAFLVLNLWILWRPSKPQPGVFLMSGSGILHHVSFVDKGGVKRELDLNVPFENGQPMRLDAAEDSAPAFTVTYK
jgi:hypothetical protein